MGSGRPGGNPNIAELGKPYQFSSTNRPKKKRPPSNLKKYMGGLTITREDVKNLFVMMALKFKNIEEVKQLVKDEDAPPLMRYYAKAILADWAKNKTDTIEKVIDRAFGKPEEFHKNENFSFNANAAVELSPEERRRLLEEHNLSIIKKYNEDKEKSEDEDQRDNNGEGTQVSSDS